MTETADKPGWMVTINAIAPDGRQIALSTVISGKDGDAQRLRALADTIQIVVRDPTSPEAIALLV